MCLQCNESRAEESLASTQVALSGDTSPNIALSTTSSLCLSEVGGPFHRHFWIYTQYAREMLHTILDAATQLAVLDAAEHQGIGNVVILPVNSSEVLPLLACARCCVLQSMMCVARLQPM